MRTLKIVLLFFFANIADNSVAMSTNNSVDEPITISEPVQLFENGELELAQKAFETQLKNDSNSIMALVYLARIAQSSEDLDRAEELIEKALTIAPENAEVQYRYGGIIGEVAGEASIFTALGYAEKSLLGLKKAVELEPSNIKYQQGLLNYYLIAPSVAGGDNEMALKQANNIQKLDEKSGFLAHFQVLRSQGEGDKLAQMFDKAIQRFPNDAVLYHERGLSHQAQENFTQAFADFEQAKLLAEKQKETELQKFDAIYQLGRTSVLSKQRVETGIEAILLFIEQAPETRALPSKEWANYRLANLYELNKQKKVAKSIYRKLYKTTEDSRLKKEVRRKR